jgi:hypothetical protein
MVCGVVYSESDKEQNLADDGGEQVIITLLSLS